MLLTYNLRIRNTDPRFHLVSCYKKHFFRSQAKNAVSYMWDVTVSRQHVNQDYVR